MCYQFYAYQLFRNGPACVAATEDSLSLTAFGELWCHFWGVQIVSSKDLALAPRWIYALLCSAQALTFWWKLQDSKFMKGPPLSLSCFGAASLFKFASLLPILGLTEDKFYDPRSTCPAKQVSGLKFIMKKVLLTLSCCLRHRPTLVCI